MYIYLGYVFGHILGELKSSLGFVKVLTGEFIGKHLFSIFKFVYSRVPKTFKLFLFFQCSHSIATAHSLSVHSWFVFILFVVEESVASDGRIHNIFWQRF